MAMRLAAASWEGDGVDKSELHGDGGGVDMGVRKVSAGDWLRGVTAGVEMAPGAWAASGAGLTVRWEGATCWVAVGGRRKAAPRRTVRAWMRMAGRGGGGESGAIKWAGMMSRGVSFVLVRSRLTGRVVEWRRSR